ncbi:hypothetical protein [Amycolatopsis sp. NPDC051903]|uniref:hypothetical protein n=1 Tax=Amycolatopsis sp. NPDC051903 TaxID=3363936 RepID=UPI0037B8129F
MSLDGQAFAARSRPGPATTPVNLAEASSRSNKRSQPPKAFHSRKDCSTSSSCSSTSSASARIGLADEPRRPDLRGQLMARAGSHARKPRRSLVAIKQALPAAEGLPLQEGLQHEQQFFLDVLTVRPDKEAMTDEAGRIGLADGVVTGPDLRGPIPAWACGLARKPRQSLVSVEQAVGAGRLPLREGLRREVFLGVRAEGVPWPTR